MNRLALAIILTVALIAAAASACGVDLAGVSKESDTSFSIDRDVFRRSLRDIDPHQAIALPWSDDTERGWKLVGVRPGSLLRSLGIRSGDVVLRVGGERIGALTPDEILARESFTVDLLRRGSRLTATYTVR